MATRLIQGMIFQSKSLHKCNYLPLHTINTNTDDIGDHKYVFITIPHIRLLRLVLARSLILAFTFAVFSVVNTTFNASPYPAPPNILGRHQSHASNSMDTKVLHLLLNDLKNQGLLKTGDRAIFVTGANGDDHNAIHTSHIHNVVNDMDLISAANLDQQSAFPDASFDFAFTNGFHAAQKFVDRSLKVGGVVVVQLGNDPSSTFNKPSNYRIVYLRRFQSANILAMRKTGNIADAAANLMSTQRRLLGYHATDAKKAALEKLEDVLLEPPRAASGKSRRYMKRTRYLPDLMVDLLESYPRHVFIDVGLPEKKGGSGTGWFAKNYPTRNLDFEMYKIETVAEEASGKEVPQVEVGISDWLRKNVKGEEYVVMKAEAEVVEEMVKSKAIRLVDELFLDCKPRKNGNGNKKAYWECLALYGKLRDEGVAVHQWWG